MQVSVLTRKERRGEDDVPHPALTVDLRVETAGHVSRHAAGQSVQDDGGGVDGAVVVHVEHSEQRHEDDACWTTDGSVLQQKEKKIYIF